MGVFETIAVKDGKLIFLDRHLRRLDRALHFLKIGTLDERGITEKQVIDYVKQQKLTDGACKLTVSKENVVFQQRQAHGLGMNERIFLNTKGQISEGTVSNIFFVRSGKLYTPDLSCGLLPGILREYLCETENVEEAVIYPAELGQYEECFVTNSLMGIMPVNQLGEWKSESREVTNQLLKKYDDSSEDISYNGIR